MTQDAGNSDAVLVERRGNVMLVTINRPEARNAVNHAVWLGCGEALAEAERDVEIRAVVITGAGDQSFCAGADLKAVSRGESIAPSEPEKAAWGFAGIVAHAISKPLIAAVNGAALGGGTEITLSSDLAVAAEHASFGLPEVKRGIIAGAGGAFRLAEQLPKKVAMEMLLTGRPIDAQRALELGLVNAVVPLDRLIDTAMGLANEIAANAPLAVQASKRIALGIADGKVAADEERWRLSHRESRLIMRSEDAQEGPKAFAQKRTPAWTGR